VPHCIEGFVQRGLRYLVNRWWRGLAESAASAAEMQSSSTCSVSDRNSGASDDASTPAAAAMPREAQNCATRGLSGPKTKRTVDRWAGQRVRKCK